MLYIVVNIYLNNLGGFFQKDNYIFLPEDYYSQNIEHHIFFMKRYINYEGLDPSAFFQYQFKLLLDGT